jgi:hypothetical protein
MTLLVMAGLVPAIHDFPKLAKTGMPGIKPGMTRKARHFTSSMNRPTTHT